MHFALHIAHYAGRSAAHHTMPRHFFYNRLYYDYYCLLRCRFTFLATLFLLLFVSSAIILRSFILRRRFRRRIEEAILAGVIPAPHTARVSRRRALGEKPKLWEARVYPAADDRWDTIAVRRHLYSIIIFPISPPPFLPPPDCTVLYCHLVPFGRWVD
jgi:hypothetical protein